MHRNHNKILFGVSSLSVGLLYGLRLNQMRGQELQNAVPYGRYTAQEVLSRADQVYPLIPQASDIRFTSANFVEVPHLQSLLARAWTVACKNSNGDAVVYLLWNADTGRLIQVSCTTPTNAGIVSNLTPLAAAQIGAAWLNRLGMTSGHAPWHLAGTPLHERLAWHISFRAGKEKAHVVLDSQDASLVLARTW